MSECILKCPKCGIRQSIDKEIYDHCMEIKGMCDKDPSVFNMVHPFTCGNCGEELELWQPLTGKMKYGFGYDL